MEFSFSRMSRRNSSLERSFNSKGTSISETFTSKVCSANSARPVLREVVITSGIVSKTFSASFPILSDSSKETPGMVAIFIVREPSLNGGKKLRPKLRIRTKEKVKRTNAMPKTIFPDFITRVKLFSYTTFRFRSTQLPFTNFFRRFSLVSKILMRTGVMVTAIISEANSETI
ncbi:hypothetical protein ES708_21886 [subsurface metagenome]